MNPYVSIDDMGFADLLAHIAAAYTEFLMEFRQHIHFDFKDLTMGEIVYPLESLVRKFGLYPQQTMQAILDARFKCNAGNGKDEKFRQIKSSYIDLVQRHVKNGQGDFHSRLKFQSDGIANFGE